MATAQESSFQGDAGISIGSCNQLLTVTEQLSFAIKRLQNKVKHRACVPGLVEDRDTGVCGIAGCTNDLYQEYNVNATTDDMCETSPDGCCKVLNCVADRSCMPEGAADLEGTPGDCADDENNYLVHLTSRPCEKIGDQINGFGHWAEGRSLHGMDGSHKTFGCTSTVAELQTLLDQSGQRDCFDHDVQCFTATNYQCAEAYARMTTAGANGEAALTDEEACAKPIFEVSTRPVFSWDDPNTEDRPFNDPNSDYVATALQFKDWCPVTCNKCGTEESRRSEEAATQGPMGTTILGKITYTYDYEWALPAGMDNSVKIEDICHITCNTCKGS